MFFFIFVLIAVICSSLTVAKKNEFYSEYCSPQNTNTVNAIFSVLIFLRHAVSYVKLDGVFDNAYLQFDSFFGQLVVVTYLFFSGYGIMESINKKGISYVKAMPVNRLLKLWSHFAIVILLYTAVSVGVSKSHFSVSRWLLAFTGFTSVGNSNWYMFVTFILYIIVIVSFLLFKKSNNLALVCVGVLSVAFVIIEKQADLPYRFFNTLLCFPLGMFFSKLKPYIDKIFMKNDILWFISFTVCITSFAYFSDNRGKRFLYYLIFTFFAVAVIIMLMMKVRIKSTILDWLGQHVFSFFILQRIPMIIFRELGYTTNRYGFIILSFFATVMLAVVFDTLMEKFDRIIFKKRKILKG